MDLSQEKEEILRRVRDYSTAAHPANRPAWERTDSFRPGVDTIPYAGRVFTEDEVQAAVGATLDFWLTLGKEGAAFEKELAAFLGVKRSVLVNSGSSANLLAVTALTSPKLPADRRIRHGDEVITVAAGFPTTLAPILQNGAVPVLVDNDPKTGNLRAPQLDVAYREGKTKAVILAHALGNPFDLGAVLEFCRAHNLWLVEDNCDALGSSYSMPVEKARKLGLKRLLDLAEAGGKPNIRFETVGEQRLLSAPTGVWGDLSTQSFYPPHHLTMGEGGAVNIVSLPALSAYVESFRDWGRDCWCASGQDDTCHKRFDWQLGELPRGYDHKYIYSHIGYNLKPLDIQAAIGRVQLRKLPSFIEARKRNWEYLRRGLADLEEYFDFTLPTHAEGWLDSGGSVVDADSLKSSFTWDGSGCRTDCSWFGFMLLVKPGAPFTRTDLARHLERCRIGNRMLFGGNLARQPAFVQLRRENPDALRTVGPLEGADRIMNHALFVGVYPGLTKPMLDYVIDVIHHYSKLK